EQRLRPIGREPHSVIGSSCIGASVIGGVCNNSGGALVRRGPAYTEYALYARVNDRGEAELCNHLGIRLGEDPEAILGALDAGQFGEQDIADEGRAASAPDYESRVRDIAEPSPARFNADPERLYEVSGCAGKVMALAVRVDTFPADRDTVTFYVGSNDPADLTRIRRRLLSEGCPLPVSAEYIHRGAYVLAETYGKDTVLAIERLGTHRLPALFAWKARIDGLAKRLPFLPANLSDRLLQAAGRLFPPHLPTRMSAFRDRFEHHLILKVADDAIEPTRKLLARIMPGSAGDMFECTAEEANKAFLHRFAVAGAAVRYRAIHPASVEDIIALDIALRRDDEQWFETLPEEVAEPLLARIYYGHFMCHVFHQDYIVRKGTDPVALEHHMWKLLDARGARYPAEHNVGHLYPASPEMLAHYRALDPANRMNPGIGQASRAAGWA
ncbi:MAG: D-lactate dehydrogenase, partial [Alphaproteobacteria bacterium HGW-Alphaproteobacteria-13]